MKKLNRFFNIENSIFYINDSIFLYQKLDCFISRNNFQLNNILFDIKKIVFLISKKKKFDMKK